LRGKEGKEKTADVKARLSVNLDDCGALGPLDITRCGKAAAVLLSLLDFAAELTENSLSIISGDGVRHEPPR
jgi:hypothetical protein